MKKRKGTLPGIGLIAFLFCVFLLLPAVSSAAPPVVKTVPWVATNPLIPHDTWSGKQITLKGTTDVQGTGYEYWWDFGDGSATSTPATVSDRYALQAFHTYTGIDGDIFTARLYVRDKTSGETGSKPYYIAIRNQSLVVEVNVAIDEGLWYLHKVQYRYASGGQDFGDWRNLSGYRSVAAACINAFEVNGHVESLVGDDNPYKETVARGLKYIFSNLQVSSISARPHGHPEDYDGDGSPDPGANGLGILLNQTDYAYQHGMIMDAIIASGTPGAVTTTGPTNVISRTYQAIIQDMVDYASYGQAANIGSNNAWDGGWYYNFGNSYGDNSICQWIAIGLIPAERNGWAQIPQWVKDWNVNHLTITQHSDGGFRYRGNYGSIYPWGPYAVSPSGMVQMVMDGVGRGDNGSPPAGYPSWDKAERFIRQNFGNSGGATVAIKDYYYGLFSFVKSMRLHNPPITMLRDYTGGLAALDWYGAETAKGASTNGVARTLVDDQEKSSSSTNGRWTGNYYDGNQNPFGTAWAIMMLGQTLFEAGSPVAVAKAVPNPGVAGQIITLSGSDSFHQDPSKTIDSWEWDLDNDGQYDDASGPMTTITFPGVADYVVGLRVTDDGSPEKEATTTVTVRITTPPIAPTADANGPYVFCPQAKPWFLDGAGSTNPDEGQSEPGKPGDTIQSYEWDLDGDGQFDDAFGPQPDVTAYFEAMGTGSYLIQLKVTDTTSQSFPSSGMNDLSDTDAAQVLVKASDDPACECVDDLTARPKYTKVQLTWTPISGAASYNVYRGTVNGGPYALLANTTSDYSTYLDTTVVTGTTYYYVVRPAALNGNELCQSNEASATPVTRVRACVNDLTARPKLTKVELSWTHTSAASYNVYRSTTAGGPYLKIANTTSTYSTYTDTAVVLGTTYYYVVREVAPNGKEVCQSNEASAKPVAR